ncbi:MAG: LPS export ABC transporter periplasmic protein LptC [Bacteroidota bacterium]
MKKEHTYNKGFATTFVVAFLFMGCGDRYERVGQEALKKNYPQGVATNFTLTLTEATKEMTTLDSSASRVKVILRSPLNEDYDNQRFKYREFPKGLQVDFFDEENQKTVVKADYGITYSQTNLVDLRGNVVIESHDGKKLETPQLYWDRKNKWIFTDSAFTFTNPEDGTVMEGQGMDFNRERTFFSAQKTFGIMTIKEEE